MIYLDNAATTFQKPKEVTEAVCQALNSLGNAGRGAHQASLDASRIIYETRELLARLFNVEQSKQVAFTSNATASLNTAINGLFAPGDHVITTSLEHNSVLRPLYRLQEQGLHLSIIHSDKAGNIDYSDFMKEIKPHTKAIVCTHASNLTGNMVDLKQVGAICKENGLLFIVDAAQTAGVFPIDMEEMSIDVLCFTGHKGLLGPQGTGGICVREGVHIDPLMVGGSGMETYKKNHPEMMPTALEAGTINGHGIVGLHAALKYIERIGLAEIRAQELMLMETFYKNVCQIPGVTIYGDFTTLMRAPIVSLNIYDYDSAEVSDELQMRYGIHTRAGGHCAPLMHEALGTVEQGVVRFSFSHFNTVEEVMAAVHAIKELAAI